MTYLLELKLFFYERQTTTTTKEIPRRLRANASAALKIGLSNKVLNIDFGQVASKLSEVKVGVRKK